MVAIEYCQNSSATAATSTSNQLNTVILSPTSSATSTASTTTTNSTNILPPAALQQHIEPESLHPKSPIPIAKDSKQTSLTKATTKTKMSDQQIATESAPSASAKTNKSAVSQRSVEVHLPDQPKANSDTNAMTAKQLSKKVLKLDLSGKDLQDFSMKSPKSPISARLPHQVSLTSSVDVEDRKTLREALYQGIFHRHRKTIFAMGSFLRMLRSRNSQYNTIRSSSEGEDIDEPR